MIIDQHVVNQIVCSIGNSINESGGILGAVQHGRVVAFEFDRECCRTKYRPDFVRLNQIIRSWYQDHIYLIGIVHSHHEEERLSYADIEYARTIIRNNGLDKFYMMIFILSSQRLVAYQVTLDEVFDEMIDIK